MKIKKSILITLLILSILMVGAVSATDTDNAIMKEKNSGTNDNTVQDQDMNEYDSKLRGGLPNVPTPGGNPTDHSGGSLPSHDSDIDQTGNGNSNNVGGLPEHDSASDQSGGNNPTTGGGLPNTPGDDSTTDTTGNGSSNTEGSGLPEHDSTTDQSGDTNPNTGGNLPNTPTPGGNPTDQSGNNPTTGGGLPNTPGDDSTTDTSGLNNYGAENGEFIDVSEAFTYLNNFRTEANVWQWNEDDKTKTYFNTNSSNHLQPLIWDSALEETAKIRAKEIVSNFSHTRPDGTKCFTAFPDGLWAKGENIAYGYSSCYSVTEAWKETDDPYSGQGHRRNMLDPNFNCVGIAGYKVNGRIYWVQSFGYKNNLENEEPQETNTNNTNNQEPQETNTNNTNNQEPQETNTNNTNNQEPQETNTNNQNTPNNDQEQTQTTTTTAQQSNTEENSFTQTKTAKTISKKAKQLTISTTLKLGSKKATKGKTVTYKIGSKTFKVKTNKKGVAKLTIKKSDLKKILKKVKAGKKIKVQIKYGKTTVTKYIKVKK